MKRVLDLAVAVPAMLLVLPLMIVLAILIKLTSPGPVLYWSCRIGRNNCRFRMPKFRSMRIHAPQLATHLLEQPEQWLTPIGSFLRRSSLDELPQLWCVITGSMSLVGPRPALFNQHDLIAMRTRAGVHELLPGITGWAQVNGRDDLPIPVKVAFDREYRERQGLGMDLQILFLTGVRVLGQRGIRH
ncbi:MAG: sugar transferase [Pseudomonadales bacterium]|nr:sugar transferase [Pseudomonadales bacterium]